eukprot:scaffold624_cov402-Prasinococcus_capsulatus_cf.AAC.42
MEGADAAGPHVAANRCGERDALSMGGGGCVDAEGAAAGHGGDVAATGDRPPGREAHTALGRSQSRPHAAWMPFPMTSGSIGSPASACSLRPARPPRPTGAGIGRTRNPVQEGS